MGRITPSFRQRYEETIRELRNGFQKTLLDKELSDSFDLLLREAWGPEQAAMNNSNIPLVIDALNITANIHNRKIIGSLKRRLEEDKMIEELKQRIEVLEDAVN